jgi:hypothetical protein
MDEETMATLQATAQSRHLLLEDIDWQTYTRGSGGLAAGW